MIEEVCTVKKTRRGYAYIELKRSEKCDGCNMCAFNKRKSMVVPAVCDINVSPGDRVAVQMPTRSVGVASLLIYAIPIALIALGAAIGLLGGVWLQVGLGAAGLVIGLLAAYLIDKAYRKKAGVLPIVTAVVRGDTDTEEIHKENNNGT